MSTSTNPEAVPQTGARRPGGRQAASPVVVLKFGGSSLADPDRVTNVARVWSLQRQRGAGVVGVVSAISDTTDGLLELARKDQRT